MIDRIRQRGESVDATDFFLGALERRMIRAFAGSTRDAEHEERGELPTEDQRKK